MNLRRLHRRLAVLMSLAGLVAFAGGAGFEPVSAFLAAVALTTALFWHPDGTHIYYTSGGSLWLAGLAGGEPQRIAEDAVAGTETAAATAEASSPPMSPVMPGGEDGERPGRLN